MLSRTHRPWAGAVAKYHENSSITRRETLKRFADHVRYGLYSGLFLGHARRGDLVYLDQFHLVDSPGQFERRDFRRNDHWSGAAAAAVGVL